MLDRFCGSIQASDLMSAIVTLTSYNRGLTSTGPI